MQKISAFVKKNRIYILSAALTVLIMLVVYISRSIWPFGDEMYLRSDMYHQYAPFHMLFKRALGGDESALYSFSAGLGTNMLSLGAYYFASPLNIFLALVSKGHVIELMSIFIIGKEALSALTFSYYLSKHFKSRDYSIIGFAIFYALSSYMAAFSWNLMWADCLWLLPLIVLGIEKLVNEGKPALYAISIGAAIFSNYYIGIMLCIFALLYFFAYLIIKLPAGGRRVLITIGRFGLYSVVAGLMAMVLILPAFYNLALTASGDGSFPSTVKTYFSFFYMLSRMLVMVKPAIFSAHDPNIYSSVAVFIFVPIYLMAKKINAREKVVMVSLTVFMLLSINVNVLDYLWHGMHFPNSLPARESFIFIFLMLTMAYGGFQNARYKSVKNLGVVTAAVAVLFMLFEHFFADGSDEEYTSLIVYVSAAFVFGYFIITALMQHYKEKSSIGFKVLTFLMILVCVAEVMVNTEVTAVGTATRSAYLKDNEAVSALAFSAEEDAEADGDLFFRMEKLRRRTKNDAAWHDYNGASIFSSAANCGVTDFYEMMGLEASTNAYAYYGATAFTGALLDVKYVLSDEPVAEDSVFTLLDSRGYEDGSRELFLLKSKYALPLGYMISEEAAELSFIKGRPFENQNAFADALGAGRDIFEDLYVDSEDGGLLIEVTKDARLYVYIENAVDSVTVTYYDDDEVYTNTADFDNLKHKHIIDLGDVKRGMSVKVQPDDGEVKSISGSGAYLNEAEFSRLISSIDGFVITDFSDTHIKGYIDAAESGTFMTSIPYEEGWILYIDGEKVETEAVFGAFVSASVSEGHHEIELKYYPKGLAAGSIISLAAVAALVLLLIKRKRKGNKEMSELERLGEKMVSSETIYDGKILHIKKDTVTLPNGNEASRELIRHVGAVCIIAVNDKGEVAVERQYRYPCDKVVTEIPAGKLDSPDEDRLLAAKRELREETGITAENWKEIGSFYPAVAYSDEYITMYIATGLSIGERELDEDEFLDFSFVPLNELVEQVMKGEIEDSKTEIAILKANMILGK